MKKAYIELLDGVPRIPLLYPNLGREERDSILFLDNAFRLLTEPLIELVDSPEKADIILLPHNYPSVARKSAYIRRQIALAKQYNKQLVVFWHGDSDQAFPSAEAIVFRTSQYRGCKRPNEIMMPAYADDLLHGELALRTRHAGKPIVGFCGWAHYKNLKNRIGTLLKNSYIRVSGIGRVRRRNRIKGITYRMKAIKHLLRSRCIEPNIIVRSSYSGHSSTIKTDPVKTRQEYIDNLLNSDYALVIKGDGNYSYRFYEALSLGRIPVVLDTGCILPLEDTINYRDFVLRVSVSSLYRIDEIVAVHYAALSSEEFMAMQKKAREAFEKYLRIDAFLKLALADL